MDMKTVKMVPTNHAYYKFVAICMPFAAYGRDRPDALENLVELMDWKLRETTPDDVLGIIHVLQGMIWNAIYIEHDNEKATSIETSMTTDMLNEIVLNPSQAKEIAEALLKTRRWSFRRMS